MFNLRRKMNTNILKKAKKIIENRHQIAQNEAINNKIEAMKDEEFNELYSKYIDTVIEEARTQTSLNSNNLKKNYEKRLKKLQIGPIEPQFYCPLCNDTGIKDDEYCNCLVDIVNELLKEESGFSSLENFELFKNKKEMELLYQKMKKWCHSNFDKTLIFLAGQTGVGKTHLLKCMANELIKLHKFVLLTSSFSMHQDFVKSYACKDAIEKQNIIEKYLDADVLFIDDLGTELRQPNITVNYLYQILNERKSRKNPTIITSNLELSDIADYYDERISSRIIDKSSSICVYITGEDLRLK